MQAVISASHAAAVGGKIAQLYIPTPETIQSTLEYERLYPRQFKQPSTYIRFSSTVEDCIGCPYCMTADDEVFLKSMNQKKPESQRCSEDQFEEVMYFFEETSAAKQPFAAVDNPPVVSYEEMESSFDETISDSCRKFAREIYEHWKNQRLLKGNRALMPTLKFETNVETDDNDPYVCFRRREVRQTRKTRGRDAQVIEKLKKMRRDLEDARQILHVCKQREYLGRENLANNRKLFEQRILLRDARRENGIKEDDDLLVDQKVRVPFHITILLQQLPDDHTPAGPQAEDQNRPDQLATPDVRHSKGTSRAHGWPPSGLGSCLVGRSHREKAGGYP